MYSELTFDEDIELGQLTETVVNREVIKQWTYTLAYASQKSVKQSEHYNAASIGLKPELVFVVRDFEYNNHERVKWKGKTFEVMRTYKADGLVELVVSTFSGVDV